jgi:hypothetical protein
MLTRDILTNLDIAIQQLFDNELDILRRGLNELNLNGHLTRYLTPLYSGYNVDPEYNGDISKTCDRKEIAIAGRRLIEIRRKISKNNLYRLTPDIIIHTRNTNINNLLVLEIKKDSNSRDEKDFDLLKLEHMTIDYSGNHYNFQVGAALIFGTKANVGQLEIIYYQNGIPTLRENLI